MAGISNFHRAIRAPENPLDKSTVVSLYPKPIREKKVTLQPGVFNIPAGTREKPGILVVGTSSWWKEIDPEQPLLEIPQMSPLVAHSIVTDWMNGLMECDMGESMPGLFWVPGNRTQKEILNDFEEQLDTAYQKQRNWYKKLVDTADTQWARSGGSPLAISDQMRLGAEELQLDKPWMKDSAQMQLENCPACGSLRDAQFPICQHCQTVIDKDRYEELGLSKAG